MTETEAKKFYDISNAAVDYLDKAFIDSVDSNLSVIKCKEKGKEANSKFESLSSYKSSNFNLSRYNTFLKSLGQSPLDKSELLETCLK